MVEITTKDETFIDLTPSSGELAIEYGNKAKQHAISAVEYAVKCGDALLKVKKELPHGEFTSWIEVNMPVTLRQCQKFMSISSYLIDTKSEVTALLESGKDINELAAEASQHKMREAARKKAKKPPKKVKPKDDYYTNIEYKYDKNDFDYSKDKVNETKKIKISKENSAIIFGIPGCTSLNTDVLKAIYRFLSVRNHPDKGGASNEMSEINKAYEALK